MDDIPKTTTAPEPAFADYADIRAIELRADNGNGYVSQLLGPGWVLLAITHTTGVVMAHPRGTGQVALAIFGKPRDHVMDELVEKARKLSKRVGEIYQDLRDCQAEKGKLSHRVASLEGEMDRLVGQLSGAHKSLRKAQDRYRALEADLAKVRAHFGDKAFQEALDAGA